MLVCFLWVAGEAVQTCSAEHDGTQGKVAKHPDEHDTGPEALVVVGLALFLGNGLDLWGRLLRELYEFGLVLGVQVAIVLGDVDVDFSAGLEVRRR